VGQFCCAKLGQIFWPLTPAYKRESKINKDLELFLILFLRLIHQKFNEKLLKKDFLRVD